jgi:hypothetical protein
MLITALVGWAKSLVQSFQKPATYGSELEAYIVSHDPQTAYDVDRLTREFDAKQTRGYLC